MIYLLLAILSSALVSVVMRLSSDKVRHNLGMLTVNYLMCVAVAACYTGLTRLFPAGTETVKTLAMGAVHGGLYLLSFVLFQNSVKKNGVVLAATFMKLGLLVPILKESKLKVQTQLQRNRHQQLEQGYGPDAHECRFAPAADRRRSRRCHGKGL